MVGMKSANQEIILSDLFARLRILIKIVEIFSKKNKFI